MVTGFFRMSAPGRLFGFGLFAELRSIPKNPVGVGKRSKTLVYIYYNLIKVLVSENFRHNQLNMTKNQELIQFLIRHGGKNSFHYLLNALRETGQSRLRNQIMGGTEGKIWKKCHVHVK